MLSITVSWSSCFRSWRLIAPLDLADCSATLAELEAEEEAHLVS